jgi:UDP-2,3-diacylglucosamine pyrophosphatase LpxH
MLRFETVVVSDIHLGARNSQATDFLRFLDVLEVDRLVIAGDLFESPVLRGLRREHLRVLEVLRQFARGCELVWLRGNHDPDDAWCRDVLDLTIQDELVVHAEGRSYLVCHGHLWDSTLSLPKLIVDAADGVYRAAQWVDPSHRLARQLKRNTKIFCRAVAELRREAVAEARQRNLSGVIVGHSHVADDDMVEDHHFLNCGCWTERPTGYVGIRAASVRQFAWRAPVRVALAAARMPLLAASGEGT